MTKRGESQREFARLYGRVTVSGLAPIPQQIKDIAENLRTLVVDTAHITDGYQDNVTAWTLAPTTNTAIITAYRATIHSSAPLLKGLHLVASEIGAHEHTPAFSGTSEIEWTSWHHGEQFELTVAGYVEEVMRYCDLTENERERIIISARKLSQDGHIVFATARGYSADSNPAYHSLTFDGLVATKLRLLPGTLNAVAKLRNMDVNLVYISSLPEDITTLIAGAAHITEHPKVARHSSFASSLDHAIYARATRVSSRHIVRDLPQPSLVAMQPLAEVVDLIMSFR